MKPEMKTVGLGIVLLMIISAIAVFMITKNRKGEPEYKIPEKTEAPRPVLKETTKKKIPVKAGPQKKALFKTNEEIKKKYGWVEVVKLYDGRSFTGAVISVDDFYSIVTTEGTKKIPLKDVKERVIIE
jgi:small nuclear ribonucleoprotein (snRNP)-like protein